MPEECPLRGRAAPISTKLGFSSSASTSCFAEPGSFPHWIEGAAGVRVEDFDTVVGGISRRRRISEREAAVRREGQGQEGRERE
jgi:hypothetical protein